MFCSGPGAFPEPCSGFWPMPDHGPAESTRLHARVRIGHGLGSFATGTFGTVPGLLLLYYLTDILGVAAGTAGLLVFLPKAWDVLLNPWVGSLSDRTTHRWGPRRPWMLLGALTMPFCFAAMFTAPGLQRGGAAVCVAVLFLLTATAYACFQVPYVALPAELTADAGERARVMSWRVAFLGAAILLSGATAPLLAGAPAESPGTPGGYRFMGLVIGGVLMLGMLAAFAATAGVRGVAQPVAEPTLFAQLRAPRGNRPFAWLLSAFCVQAVATGLMLAGTQYYATDILGRPNAPVLLFACLIVPCLLAMPLWLAIGLRTGKRAAAIAASLCFLAGALTTGFAPVLPLPAVSLAGVGYAGMQTLPPAMLGDPQVRLHPQGRLRAADAGRRTPTSRLVRPCRLARLSGGGFHAAGHQVRGSAGRRLGRDRADRYRRLRGTVPPGASGDRALIAKIGRIEGIRVLGRPDASLIAVAADGPLTDPFVVADEMRVRGWYLQPQPAFGASPANLHLTVTAAVTGPETITELLIELEGAVARHVRPVPSRSTSPSPSWPRRWTRTRWGPRRSRPLSRSRASERTAHCRSGWLRFSR